MRSRIRAGDCDGRLDFAKSFSHQDHHLLKERVADLGIAGGLDLVHDVIEVLLHFGEFATGWHVR